MEDRHKKLLAEEKEFIKKWYKVEDKGFWSACWGAGYVDLSKISVDVATYEDIGGYLSKYMSKSFLDTELFGKKLFFRSRNLDKPQEFFNDEAEEVFKENISDIIGIYEIKTNYAAFTKITIFRGKKSKREVNEKVYEDCFCSLSDFIYEYETGLFKKKYEDIKMDLKSLYLEGYLSQDNYYTYSMIVKEFKRQQEHFEYTEEFAG